MNCKDIIRKTFGEEFTAKDIDAIYEEASSFIAQRAEDGKPLPSIGEVVEKIANRRKAYIQTKTRYAQQILKNQQLKVKVDTLLKKHGVSTANAKDIMEGFISSNGKYQIENLETYIASLTADYINVIKELEGTNAFAFLRDKNNSKELHKELATAVYELSMGGKVKYSNPEVQTIAETIHALNKRRLHDLREAGFSVEELKGYVFSGSFDPNLVRQMGFEEFSKKIRDNIDIEATARKWGIAETDETDINLNEMIADVYQTITTKDISSLGKVDRFEDIVNAIKNPSQMNKVVSRGRAFVYKDGASFYEVFNTFSGNNLFEAVLRDASKTARTVANARMFGTTPTLGFEMTMKHVNASLIANGQAPLTKDVMENLYFIYRSTLGDVAKGDNMIATIASNSKKFVDLALMGKAGIKALLTDPIHMAHLHSVMSKQNYYVSYAQSIYNTLKMFSPSQKKEILNRLTPILQADSLEFVKQRTMNGGLFTRGLTKIHNGYMKVTGLSFQNDLAKSASSLMASFELAEKLQLSDSARLSYLKTFGFTDTDMKFLSKSLANYNGSKIVDPSVIERMTDAEIIEVLGTANKKVTKLGGNGKLEVTEVPYTSDELKAKARVAKLRTINYLNDISLAMSPTPTNVNKFYLQGKLDTSTVGGATVSLMAQYKSFAAGVYRAYRKAAWFNDVPETNRFNRYVFGGRGALINTFLMGTVSGGAALMLTDILSGKTPRDPTRPEFLYEAFAASGSGGLLSDYMLENYERGRKQWAKDFIGPAIGRLYDDAALLSTGIKKSIAAGDEKAAVRELSKLHRWVPANNLWLTQATFDTLFMNKWREWADPRYKSKQRKQMREMSGKLYNQERLLPDDLTGD